MFCLIIFHDFRFGLGIVTTHLNYHCLKGLFPPKKIALLSKHYTMLTQLSSFSHVEKTFRAFVCQMCGKYSKTKSKIMKHYLKIYIIFFLLNCRSWDFKPMLEKSKPTLVDSSSDKPKAPIRNIASQPFWHTVGSLLPAGLLNSCLNHRFKTS